MNPTNPKPIVLIVDDEPSNIHIVAQALRDDYDLRVATCGEDALLRALAEPRPDLILLDIVMPGIDGFEVCRRLKRDDRTHPIPVVFTTGVLDGASERLGFELGAVDYLIKPINTTILQARVHALLEMRDRFVRRANILIVDDVAINVEMVANILRDGEWSLHTACSGEDALAKLDSLLFDLVLLDVLMPGIDGLEVCRRMKASPLLRNIPVIMLTAKTDPASVVEGFRAGAQDYVAKPFNDQELLVRVQTHLALRRKEEQLKREKERSERLLLNILPRRVVQELRTSGRADVQEYPDVTVLFADIVNFTRLAAGCSPRLVINELNEIFTAFDEIVTVHHCDRIKTIGDAYLAVCGMPEPNERHAELLLRAAIELRHHLQQRNASRPPFVPGGWKMRFGIHSGEAVGGVVGIRKYIYDIFGDAINTAARVESCSEPMEINVSEATRRLVPDGLFRFRDRGTVEVKSKGPMRMFYLDGLEAGVS